MSTAPDAPTAATTALCACCKAKPRDVQLREIRIEIKRLKDSLRSNEEVLDGMLLVVGIPESDKFVQDVQRTVDHQKQLITILEQIKKDLEE